MLISMVVKTLSVLGVLLLGRGTYGDKSQLMVTTPLGVIEGYVGHSVNSQPFLKFEGIPYAKPPIGNLRFEEPQDPEPWKGIWKANVLTGCMQYDHFMTDYKNNYVVHGDEDCLHVNVYTHTIDPQAKLDVLVHIHGGAFMFGRGASYGPDIIMDRPIVFVNFNYRLGPLGFLSTEDNTLPGNMGLKDQIKALEWVKKNIHLFGGNPNSITLHGMSAGGASVHLHYFLPESRGLFKHGISQSGCALNPWVLAERVKEKALKVADLVGCPSTGNSEETKKCLKSKPARHIVHAVGKLQPFLYNPFSPFGVVVDGQWAKKPVLPEHPYKLLTEGKVLDVPWMISYTKDEGLYPASDFWANEEHLKEIDSRWNELLPFILHYNETLPAELKNKVGQLIREQYMGDKPINRETFSSFVDIFSDRLFVSGIETAARIQSQAVKSNIYCYQYNYRGSSSLSDLIIRSDTNIGVSHGDDTILILKLEVAFPKYELSTQVDKQTSKLLIDITTSFMEKGAPNISSTWPPVPKNPKDPFVILLINKFDDLELLPDADEGQFHFWDQIPFEENRRLFTPKILSDRLFIVDIETSATLQNSVVSSNIFSYVYNYRGNVSKSQGRIKCDANIGISHGDDTIYILSTAFNTRSTPSDAKMGNILIDLTTSFMKFGKPNITTFWEPFSKQLRGFYQLRILGPDNFEMERNVQIGQSNFWRQLLFEENNNLKAQFKEEL